MLKEQSDAVVKLINQRKAEFYNSKLNDANNKEMFRILDSLLNANPTRPLPMAISDQVLAEQFSGFFREKINKIRRQLDADSNGVLLPQTAAPITPLSTAFVEFELATPEIVRKIVKTSPPKSCSLDPIPTSLLRNEELLNCLLPTITFIVNDSLMSGSVPDALKVAHVYPRLKKPSLDKEKLNHYRPVSNLPFLGKVLEKVVAHQLTKYLEQHKMMDPYQSAYRRGHSTETALIKVKTDMDVIMSDGDSVLLVLLDLSAAFDTIEHSLLVQLMENVLGMSGTVLAWFCSYLKNRKQAVVINNAVSQSSQLSVGVPQGSVLGPLLFSLYIVPLSGIIDSFSISRHGYADDTQLYCRLPTRNPNEIRANVALMNSCICAVRSWMLKNKLKINDEKTEVMLLGSKGALETAHPLNLKIRVGTSEILPTDSVRNLGVILDPGLSMDKQVSSTTRAAYFHLRRIRQVRPYITKPAAVKAVHACVTSRLDAGNSLLLGCTESRKRRLQLVQNNAARVVTGTKASEHITPVLKDLHWLPIAARIQFKILGLIHSAVHADTAPQYLKDFTRKYVPSRSLRSSNDHFILVKSTHNAKCFVTEGFKLWNDLPLYVREITSQESFKRQLKTYLFKKFFN